MEFQEALEGVDKLFRAKRLAYAAAKRPAYAASTWKSQASGIKGFLKFCLSRELGLFYSS
jgi:hypothetical protein